MDSLPPLSHFTIGLSGIIASMPGSSAGLARLRATSARKSTSCGATGTAPSSSPHFKTDR